MKKLLALACITSAQVVVAADYQTFASLSYLDSKTSGYDGFVLNATHYFAAQTTGGVMDEFGYLDTDSKIFAELNNLGSDELVSVGGEYFYNENFFVNGSYARYDDSDANSIGLGYLLNDNLKLSVFRFDSDNADEQFHINASYSHQLSGKDYIGVTFDSDTDFDVQQISARYFMALTEQQYLALNASVYHSEDDDILSAEANYYFNPAMSLGVGVSDSQWLVKTKMYIDNNIAVFASYQDQQELFQIGVSGQY
ncbi:hypothetical protein PULV_a3522 [Pseudoalteromonas ulvae UL12]|uniref:putative porin n=1 Tax=Pseudoalteromonas ulvae TaxID=107327 RepID=UPI00186B5DA2|nr:putative porin [Pseudoalteromonas ulvae]MBE0363331.1 hypothetical protein [Pseudoalteromonas ulvae UL12]